MKSKHNSSVHRLSIGLAITVWATALVVMPAPLVQAACIITIPPADSEKIDSGFDEDGVLELAGGPEEPLSCSLSPYLRSTGKVPDRIPAPKADRARAEPHRSHTHNGFGLRNLDLAHSFGFRYPGFMRVYKGQRHTSSVRVYSGSRYSGATRTYSGPRFTNTSPGIHSRPRFTGFSQTYRSHRYTGFSRAYAGPRYPWNITTSQR